MTGPEQTTARQAGEDQTAAGQPGADQPDLDQTGTDQPDLEQTGTDQTGLEQERPFWHLAELVHWEAAVRVGRYERSTLDATLQDVGFIHASYPEQLPGVARAHYSRVKDALVVLEIDPARVREAGLEVRVEPGDPADPGSDVFPHVYGPLPVSAVVRTRSAAVEKWWLDLGPWDQPPGSARGGRDDE